MKKKCLLFVLLALVAGTWNGALRAQENSWRGIRVAPENRCAPYNRSDYSYPQSVELAIINAAGGEICSPYTGQCFASRNETDIEHIIALSEAHDSGLCAASATVKKSFAADLRNLTLAAPALNRYQKGARDGADWLPSQNRCWFAQQIVAVRRAYDLSIDQREATALEAVLSSCGSGSSIASTTGTAYRITYAGRVNVRSCASTTCTIVTRFPSGQALQVLEVVTGTAVNGNTRWLRVQHEGERVYVHASLAEPVGTQRATARPTSQPRATTTPNINLSGPTTTHYSLGGVNVRSCPGTSCGIVGRLTRGERVAVLQSVNGESINGSRRWQALRYQNSLAYVHAPLLSQTKPAPPAPPPAAKPNPPAASPPQAPPAANPAPPPPQPPADNRPSYPGLSCKKIREQYGAGNFGRDHPAYNSGRDRDGDGIACEL